MVGGVELVDEVIQALLVVQPYAAAVAVEARGSAVDVVRPGGELLLVARVYNTGHDHRHARRIALLG
jgi:hypothetical protein